MWIGRGTFDADGLHGLPPHLFALLRDVGPVTTFIVGPLDDLVVNVGDIRDVVDLEPGPGEIPAQHIEHQRETTVTQMGRAVHRWSAHVHRNLPRFTGFEGHNLALSGIEEMQHDWQRYLSPRPLLRVCT